MDSSIDQPLGITPPISTNLPTQAEMTSNEALLEHLRKENSFESASDTEKRKQVLKKLEQIANAFIKQVAKAKEPHNARLIKDAIGRIFTYGSYRLGVYGPGSDIDTLLIAPKYVTREDYFTYFPDILREMSPDDAIEDLTPVEDAFVPIIKMEYCGISIDLIFSKIATLKQLPSDSNWTLQDSNLLRGLDEAELRSVNGTRVTDEIINLVPEPSTFRLALRAIKLWAQRRAVYGNIIGFPGGVAWAMMVARVCQLYPKAASSVIVHKFFNIMLKWPWPDPVLLKAIEAGPLNVAVWNPKVNRRDAQNLMPIITPAYPSMCATYNVTKSTMSVIKRELNRAGDIAAKIIEGRAPWKDLFERHSFFTDGYKFYLAINTTSTSKEHHKLWSGFIESKVRILCQNLENHDTIDLAHPFIKGFNRKHWCKNDDDRREVANGNMDFWVKESDPAPKTTGTKQEEANGADAEAAGFEVYSYTHYVGIELIGRAKSLDLSAQIQKFKSICTDWQRYKDEFHKSCALTITIMRNFDLPDDCFGPGDVKPARPKKKKKRSAPDGSPPPAKRQQTSVAAVG